MSSDKGTSDILNDDAEQMEYTEHEDSAIPEDESEKKERFMSIYDDMPDETIDYLLKTYPRSGASKTTATTERSSYRSADTRSRKRYEGDEKTESKTIKETTSSEFVSRLNIANVTLIGIIFIFGIVVLFLVIRTNKVINEREVLTAQLADYTKTKQELESLKVEYSTLEDENKTLKEEALSISTMQQNNSQTSTGNNQQNDQQTAGSSAIPETYTVKKNETLWIIAKKFYGRGEHYIAIMEENGINDDKKLKEGMVIKLPKISN